jgi:hypothetical protein
MHDWCLDCREAEVACDTCRLDALVRRYEQTTGRPMPVSAYTGALRAILAAERRSVGAVEGDASLSPRDRRGLAGAGGARAAAAATRGRAASEGQG